jgi:TonB family protein
MNFRAVPLFGCLGILMVPVLLLGQGSQAFVSPGERGSAVDAKGNRHTIDADSGRFAPWVQDCVKCVAPYYSYEDRRLHHTGEGWFRIYLELQTGVVTQIAVLKSTGFATLDNSAIAAFRRSRWKPGRWKQIDMPVRFILQASPSALPPGSVRLPSS